MRRQQTSIAVARLGPGLGGQPGHAKVGEKAKRGGDCAQFRRQQSDGLFFFLSQKKDLRIRSITQQMFIGVY